MVQPPACKIVMASLKFTSLVWKPCPPPPPRRLLAGPFLESHASSSFMCCLAYSLQGQTGAFRGKLQRTGLIAWENTVGEAVSIACGERSSHSAPGDSSGCPGTQDACRPRV